MKIRPRSILLPLTALFVLCVLPAVLPAQSCDEVRFRLWQKDDDTTFVEHGEAVEIVAGESGHVYVHVSGAAEGRSSHYSTRAAIGYPGHLGMEKSDRRHRPGEIAQHLTIKPQNASDRDAGRLRLEAEAPGDTVLGYRIEGVKSPGRLEMVAPHCREGVIPIRVTEKDAVEDGEPDDGEPESDRRTAARELTAELMTAFLRRDVDEAAESFVEEILDYGRDGILSVAGRIASSREFRTRALERTDEAHDADRRQKRHRPSLADLRVQLLEDVYRDLYGYVEPSRDEKDADLRDLELCLDGTVDACERLGREIVARRAFYDRHRELLDRL